MVGYIKEEYKGRLETRYIIEYIDNENDFDYVNSGKINQGEPWDRFKKRIFDNIDAAISLYMVYLVWDKVYCVKLFEEIIVDGETVMERYIEPKSTTAFSVKTTINKKMYNANEEAEQRIEELEKINSAYKAFIKKGRGEEMFYSFLKEMSEKRVYKYYSLARPVMPGTFPKKGNVENIKNYDERILVDDIGRLAWGYIEYSEPITRAQCNDYELEPDREAWKVTK